MPNYIPTAETMETLKVTNTGLRKLRALYRAEGRIKDRELFTATQLEELKRIVAYQRSHPHISFEDAYNAVTATARIKAAEEARTKALISRIFDVAPDDLTPLAQAIMGEQKLERFFTLFNELTDLLRQYDDDAAQTVISVQSLVLAKICICSSSKDPD